MFLVLYLTISATESIILIKFIFVFFGLAAGSPLNITLPGGLSNGLYLGYYNDAGQQVHEKIAEGNLNITAVKHTQRQALSLELPSLSKRGNYGDYSWCGCGFTMNAGDTNVANAEMHNWVSSSPSLACNTVAYYIQNTAVVFAINYDGAAVNLPSNMQSASCPAISYNCGNFIAGTIQYEETYAHLDYGYMNYFSGLNILGAAEGSRDFYCPGTPPAACATCAQNCSYQCQNIPAPGGIAACEAGCRQNGGCEVCNTARV